MNTLKVYYTNGQHYTTSTNSTAKEFEAYLKQDGGRVTFEDSNGKEFHLYIDRVEQIVYHVFTDGHDDFYYDYNEANQQYEKLAKTHANVRFYWEIEEDGETIEEDYIKGQGEFPL